MTSLRFFSLFQISAVLLISLVIGSSAHSQPTDTTAARELDFIATLKLVSERSTSIEFARRRLEAAELESKNAFAAFFPKLDLTANVGAQDAIPSRGISPQVSDLRLSLSETLWDDGLNFLRYRLAELTVDQARTTLIRERNQAYYTAAERFLRFSSATQRLKIERERADNLRKQFKIVSSNFRQGLRTRKDFLRFRAQLQRSELELRTAELEVLRSEISLRELIVASDEASNGAKYTFKPIDLNEGPDRIPSGKLNFTEIPSGRVTIIGRELADQQARIDVRQVTPDVTLAGNIDYYTGNYINPSVYRPQSDNVEYSALLTFRWTLWDWGSSSRTRRIAETNRVIRQNELETELRTLRTTVEQQVIDLRNAEDQYKVSRELVSLEVESFNALERDYRNGQASYLDLITGLDNLVQARISLFTASADLRRAIFQYQNLEGTLYDAINSAQK